LVLLMLILMQMFLRSGYLPKLPAEYSRSGRHLVCENKMSVAEPQARPYSRLGMRLLNLTSSVRFWNPFDA
jgi:hypothetical protein